jgi:hypothetical protein
MGRCNTSSNVYSQESQELKSFASEFKKNTTLFRFNCAEADRSLGGKIVVQQSRKRCMVPELAVQIGNSGQDEQFAKASLAALRKN